MANTNVLVSTKENREQTTEYAVMSSPPVNGKAIHIGMSYDKGIFVRVRDMNTGKMHESLLPIDQFVDSILALVEAQENAQSLLQKQEG